MNDIPIFIPSYHRPDNIKTAKYFVKNGWEPNKIYVFIDSEADDKEAYEESCRELGINLQVFDMAEARARYDYIHRASKARRSAGQARNMFFDFAERQGIDFYIVQDDDTNNYEIKKFGKYVRLATIDDVRYVFHGVKDMMIKRHIGLFGISQTGDFIGANDTRALRLKVMNTTFVNRKYIYRGERGVQDNDTSLFVGVMNEGLFTGSIANGLILKQTPSAKAKGGLTDLYKECQLLNKSLVVPIQFPSCVYAERQIMNGGRLHHHIQARFLYPKLIKVEKGNNLAWDKYEEDIPFTNEPKRKSCIDLEQKNG